MVKKFFKISFEMITENSDFSTADVKGELQKFVWSKPVKQIRNLKIKKQSIK